MHDECSMEIYDHLNSEAQAVFGVSIDSPSLEERSIEDLIQAARSSNHRIRVALTESRGATLVTRKAPVRLTSNGRRLEPLLRLQNRV